MPAETMHYKPGEKVTKSGIILPAEVVRQRNVRETFRNDQVEEEQPLEVHTPTPESPYDAFVLGGETSTETQTQVLEHVVSDMDALRAENTALAEKVAALERALAESRGEKFPADKQPRRVRKEGGVTEKLIKYTDGSFAWEVVKVDPADTSSEVAEVEEPAEAVEVDEVSEESAPALETASSSEAKVSDSPALAPEEEPVKVADVAAVPEVQEKPDKEPDLEPGTYYNGKKIVSIRPVDGSSKLDTNEDNQIYATDEENNHYAILESELVIVKKPVDVASDVVEKEPGRLDKMKNWFKKERKYLQEYGGMAYFSRIAENADRGIRSATLDVGVHDGLMDWEKQEKRDRNRRVILAGVGALAAWALYKGISSGDLFGGDAPDVNAAPGSGTEAPAVDPAVKDVLDGNVDTGYELPPTEPAPADIPAIPSEQFVVPNGGGGEDLLEALQIDPAKWYGVENTLLDQFPNDFYRMDDGHVGIMNSGMIPQGAQDIISTLR